MAPDDWRAARQPWPSCRRLRLAAVLAGAVILADAAAQEARLPIEVCGAGFARHHAIAELLFEMPVPESVSGVFEAGQAVPFQADAGDGGIRLMVLLEGELDVGSCRRIDVVVGGTVQRHDSLVVAERVDEYQWEPAIRIKARNATNYYHVGGSGFASLIDRDGIDWIGYRPGGGFQGRFRGLPNIAPPDFHPGRPQGKERGRIAAKGPSRVQMDSATEDGQWKVRWEIFPDFGRMTLLAKGPERYWILFEGTPGGTFDGEWDYWRNSAGQDMSMLPEAEKWNGKLPDLQWALFGDQRMQRGLYIGVDPHDDHWDEFWHGGSGGMTVFGLGRGPKPQWQYLDAVPAKLTVGFVEHSDQEAVPLGVESASRPLEYRIGEWTAAPR